MANSRSNIYPVQLQGAELNLNKFDAEIKQYSGFNKNNSPFVGGCLSNVFEKDETIEGATDENTYIDENGDVYQVDTNGLYKNDEKVISFDRQTIFWEKEKLTFPNKKNIVKIFSDDLWLEKVMYGNSAVYELKSSKPISNPVSFSLGYNETEEWFLNAGLNYTFFTVEATGTYNIFVLMRNTKNGAGGQIYFYSNYYTSNDWQKQAQLSQIATGFMNGLFFDSVNKHLMTYFRSNASKRMWVIQLVADNHLNISSLGAINIDGATNDINAPKFFSDFYRLQPIDYPHNAFILNDVIDGHNSSLITSIPGMYKDPYYDSENNLVKFRHIFMLPMTGTGRTGLYDWNNNGARLSTDYKLEGTNTKLFKVFDFIFGAKYNSSSDLWSTCWTHFNSEEIPNYIGYRKDTDTNKMRWVAGDYIKLGKGFHAAFNNNVLSGICGKYVLLTNWNTVKAENVFYFEKQIGNKLRGFVIYEEDGEYYLLKAGNPKITHGLNQIITNADSLQNSYDIKRDKVLFFAPALNSFKFDYTAYDPSQNTSNGIALNVLNSTFNDNIFIGFSLNEYSLEDNCSLLLNPISIATDYDTLLHTSVVGNLPDIFINIYSNIDRAVSRDINSIVVSYQFSSKFSETYDSTTERNMNYEITVDTDLLKLPYPIDTNGNVQYSPCLFGKVVSNYGNMAFYLEGSKGYPLNVGNNNQNVFSFYLGSEIENFESAFIIQGQYFGIIGENIFSLQYYNGAVSGISFIVSRKGLSFVGNTPYEALFFSKTNRCLYSFTGANVLNQKQFVDKINEVRNYLYNPATQTVFLITDIGVLFYGLFGMFLLEYTNITNIFLLDNGIVMSDNSGNYHYIKYYLDEGDTDYLKKNIQLETCFYGMNNQTITINDCLYFRLFSEEHEEGELKVSATTISLSGRKTEETTFKINANDWDKITHTIYLRYQPKTQRGLGVSFSIDSPFKIASLSVGSQPDAILVDKISKGAINAPFNNTSSQTDW